MFQQIATPLNQSLQPLGITAYVGLKDGCLYVSLVSVEVPDRSTLVELIRQEIIKLQDESIEVAKISGRQVGNSNPVWQQELNLKVVAPPVPSFNVNFEGENSGQLAIGSRIIQIGSVHGGIVNIASNEQQSNPKLRPTPVFLRPRAFPNLVGRKEQIENAIASLQSNQSVEFYSQAGLGKTVLLRHLAYHPQASSSFRDGVISFSTNYLPVSDFLQSFFDAFYESEITFKPTETQIRIALQNKQALILLDDNNLAQNELQQLMDAVPNSTFLMASSERCLWGEGKAILMPGLTSKDALSLLEVELQRALTSEEIAVAQTLCNILKGHPLQLLLAAARVREKGESFAEIVSQIQPTIPTKSLLNKILSFRSKSEQKILHLLAALGGIFILPQQAAALTEITDNIETILHKLVQLRLVETDGDRYSINHSLAEVLQTEWDLTTWLEKSLTYFTTFSAQQPSRLLLEINLLLLTIKWAIGVGRWTEILYLVKVVESRLALSKKWGLWQQFLQWGLQAAQGLKDRPSEAWALHQIGTRALCLEDYVTADNFLNQALQIRESLGDKIGAEITRHNLNLVPVTPQPNPPAKSDFSVVFKSAISILVLIFGGSLIWSIWPKVVPDPIITPPPSSPPIITPPPSSPTAILKVSLNPNSLEFAEQSVNRWQSKPVTIINQGTAPLKVGEITPIDNKGDFEKINKCPNTIFPENSCQISIKFYPKTEGEHRARLTITDNEGKEVKSLLLSGIGINRSPVAKNDTITTQVNTPIQIKVLVNDTDPNGDPFTITSSSQGEHGKVEINRNRTNITYIPNPDFFGSDKFDYTISDGKGGKATATVTITVEEPKPPENRPPVANNDNININNSASEKEYLLIDVLKNDNPDVDSLTIISTSQGEKGSAKINDDQTITYTPERGFSGTDTFTYTISDGKGGEATATVTITVEEPKPPENRPPVANNDSININSSALREGILIDVLKNDNPDVDSLTIISTSQGEKGSAKINDDQTITYTPERGFSGTDTFTYRISDSKGGEATATVTITVEEPKPETSTPGISLR
ncbi:Ig-like domain-containing protein [Argonema antarcticum]|uniref:Ig-like domain-containing protein n=1 Tax=Argonema antarcticum TaxID=2942763 RepID=UPI002011BDDB|nr:Ig-like domain-containing protein [Argonema antarcticum]MCL1473756.1 tandem-95 repeat protein [Argonema antarcticum A004/B2]